MLPGSLDWSRRYASFRTPVFGRNVVATSQPLAAQAGIEMLSAGGNAVDAALATAIALTVVEPTMNGVGGDAFALVWDGDVLHGLNASGKSPAAWQRSMFPSLGAMPAAGWESVTVPGAVSAWVALSRRFGVLPFATLFGPAQRYARDGFMVPPFIASTWSAAAERHRVYSSYVDAFMPGGRTPRPGELFRNEPLADTLQDIAETFGESFYRGRLAARIVSFARETGGLLAYDDLAAHTAAWVEPASTEFGGFTLHEIPPNSQGIAALIALSLLRETDVCRFSPDSAESLRLQLRAMSVAMDEVKTKVADPRQVEGGAQGLLSGDNIARLAAGMRTPRAPEIHDSGRDWREGDTVYLAAADAGGTMVSFIQSNYFDFGSGLVVPGTGISLHSRAACFSLERGHPNEVTGGKRPFHTLSPAFVSQSGKPVMSFGVMGGHMQPQGHVQSFLRICALLENPQTACDAPRWHLAPDGLVLLEEGFPELTVDGLRALGYRLQVMPYGDPVFGGGQFALVLPSGYCAASDPRKDGQAVAV